MGAMLGARGLRAPSRPAGGARLGTEPPADPRLPRYRMGSDPAGWLAIDPENGIVTAAQPLDRESVHAINSTYKAIVLAVDNGEDAPRAAGAAGTRGGRAGRGDGLQAPR